MTVYGEWRIVVIRSILRGAEMAKTTGFAVLLRRTIKADDRSLYRIAKDSGVAVAVLQRFVSGERGLNLNTAEKICRVVGLELRPKRKGR